MGAGESGQAGLRAEYELRERECGREPGRGEATGTETVAGGPGRTGRSDPQPPPARTHPHRGPAAGPASTPGGTIT